MLNLIAFILTIAGCINWLLIGLLQYDFVAGLFGYQASIFSRLIYITIGIAAIFVVLKLITNKGSFKLYQKSKKKEKMVSFEKQPTTQISNIESSKEIKQNNEDNLSSQKEENNSITPSSNSQTSDSIFDEHFNK